MHLIFHVGKYPETASAVCITESSYAQFTSKSIFSGLLEVLSLFIECALEVK